MFRTFFRKSLLQFATIISHLIKKIPNPTIVSPPPSHPRRNLVPKILPYLACTMLNCEGSFHRLLWLLNFTGVQGVTGKIHMRKKTERKIRARICLENGMLWSGTNVSAPSWFARGVHWPALGRHPAWHSCVTDPSDSLFASRHAERRRWTPALRAGYSSEGEERTVSIFHSLISFFIVSYLFTASNSLPQKVRGNAPSGGCDWL